MGPERDSSPVADRAEKLNNKAFNSVPKSYITENYSTLDFSIYVTTGSHVVQDGLELTQ